MSDSNPKKEVRRSLAKTISQAIRNTIFTMKANNDGRGGKQDQQPIEAGAFQGTYIVIYIEML